MDGGVQRVREGSGLMPVQKSPDQLTSSKGGRKTNQELIRPTIDPGLDLALFRWADDVGRAI